MKPKRLFTAYRFRLIILIACLLCLFGPAVASQSLTIYNIPIVGWILAVGEYRYAHAAYWQAIDQGVQPLQQYYGTNIAFAHTHSASITTLAFLTLCSILISWFCRRTQPLNSTTRTSLENDK